MSLLKQNQVNDIDIPDSKWKRLYKLGGAAAMITALITPDVRTQITNSWI